MDHYCRVVQASAFDGSPRHQNCSLVCVIASLTINGDKATVTVLKEGLKRPTGIEPAGDTLWFTETDAGKADSIPLAK